MKWINIFIMGEIKWLKAIKNIKKKTVKILSYF